MTDEKLIETYRYMLDLSNRAESTCEMTREHLNNYQDRYKAHFDRKVKVRHLEIGLMDEFPSIFSSNPRQTNLLSHSIEETSPDPIRCKAYPIDQVGME